MLFRLELEHPLTTNKHASILYGYPNTLLRSKGHISILWTQLLEKYQWSRTVHWIETSSFATPVDLENAIRHLKSFEGVKDFVLLGYQDPDFPRLYKKYMESGLHTRKEFDDKMEELLGKHV